MNLLANHESNYYPFGMVTPGRSFTAGDGYRFGFNGKESDPETYGSGNIYDYGFRIYNPRLGKFLSVDPLTDLFAWYSPYQFAGNDPVNFIDLDGLEKGRKPSSPKPKPALNTNSSPRTTRLQQHEHQNAKYRILNAKNSTSNPSKVKYDTYKVPAKPLELIAPTPLLSYNSENQTFSSNGNSKGAQITAGIEMTEDIQRWLQLMGQFNINTYYVDGAIQSYNNGVNYQEAFMEISFGLYYDNSLKQLDADWATKKEQYIWNGWFKPLTEAEKTKIINDVNAGFWALGWKDINDAPADIKTYVTRMNEAREKYGDTPPSRIVYTSIYSWLQSNQITPESTIEFIVPSINNNDPQIQSNPY